MPRRAINAAVIVLDTNVVSEAMRPEPNSNVMGWLNAQTAEALYLSSVTLAELLFGIGAVPSSARKDRLAQALDRVLALFPRRVLSFDQGAAPVRGQGCSCPYWRPPPSDSGWVPRCDRGGAQFRRRYPEHQAFRAYWRRSNRSLARSLR